MRPTATVYVLVIGLLAGCGPSRDEPGPEPLLPPQVEPSRPLPPDAFAPLADIPDHLVDDPSARLDVGLVRTAEVPRRDEVGVPAYPGARIVQTQPRGEVTLEGIPIDAFPIVTLLTPDDRDAVVAFYREALPDWHHERILTQHWFWTGPARFNPLDRQGMRTHAVGIMEEVGPTSPLMPDARTRIQIRYPGE